MATPDMGILLAFSTPETLEGLLAHSCPALASCRIDRAIKMALWWGR